MNTVDLNDVEKALRWELKKAEGRKTKKPVAKKASSVDKPRKGLLVTLSVREQWGGPTKRFEHIVDTISEFEAVLEAERKARSEKLVPWCTISTEKV